MKTLRRLALLALFGIAGTAAAGPPASNAPAANAPARNAPGSFTPEQLGELLKARHRSVEQTGEGDAKMFNLSKLTHLTEDGKETISWSVSVKLHQRADRSPVVRVFFPWLG